MSTEERVTTHTLPPAYSEPFSINDADNGDPSSGLQLDDLPVYAPGMRPPATTRAPAVRPPEPKEFHYELNKKGKAFVILTLIAERSYSKHMPTFVEGQQVKGRVRLSLDKPDTIQSVVIAMRGQIITGANPTDNLTFMDVSIIPWSHSDGEPINASSDEGNSSPASGIVAVSPAIGGISGSSSQSPKFNGKLQGDYTWPFCIELPREVVLPSVGARTSTGPQVFSLPQTFNERHTRASVIYDVSVQLTRGKLRTDHRIAAPFRYIPLTLPPPFPPLRGLAYQEGTPLLSPIIDPEGWFSPESVYIRGTIFNNRIAQVRCTLFLAKPLSYTKGSVIPFCLRLESADEHALDLLSSPKAVLLRLRRRIKYHWNADKTLESAGWKDAVDDSQLAVWWPFIEGSDERSGEARYVNGELHLRADVKPSSAMAQFRIEYSVVLFPFDAPGFSSSESVPLLEHPVEIVTSYAPGPRPRMSAPPGYESDVPITSQMNAFSTAGVAFF